MHTPDHPSNMSEGEYERIKSEANALGVTFAEYREIEAETAVEKLKVAARVKQRRAKEA